MDKARMASGLACAATALTVALPGAASAQEDPQYPPTLGGGAVVTQTPFEAPPGGTSLPFTGQDIAGLVGVAAGSLAGGAVLLVLARRGRRTARAATD